MKLRKRKVGMFVQALTLQVWLLDFPSSKISRKT
jgi:hypothetical protein